MKLRTRSQSTDAEPVTLDVQPQTHNDPEPAPAPEADKPRQRFSGGYSFFESMPLDIRSANDYLTLERLPVIIDDPSGGGGGSVLTRGRYVFEFSGSGAGVREGAHDRNRPEIRIGGGEGQVRAGMLVVNRPFLRVFPFVSTGVFGGGLTAIDTSGDRTDVGGAGGTVGTGVGVDMLVPLWRVRLFIGMRAGYRQRVGYGGTFDHRGPSGRPFLNFVAGFEFRHRKR